MKVKVPKFSKRLRLQSELDRKKISYESKEIQKYDSKKVVQEIQTINFESYKTVQDYLNCLEEAILNGCSENNTKIISLAHENVITKAAGIRI